MERCAGKRTDVVYISNIYALLQFCAKFSGLWRIATAFHLKCDRYCDKRLCVYLAICAACSYSAKVPPNRNASSPKSKGIPMRETR